MPSWELAMTGSYIIRIAPYSRYSKNKLADYEVQNGWWSTEEIILNCWKGQIYHAFTTRKNPCVNATLRKWPISIGMAMTPILGTVGGTITVRQISSLNRLDALVVCEFASLILTPGGFEPRLLWCQPSSMTTAPRHLHPTFEKNRFVKDSGNIWILIGSQKSFSSTIVSQSCKTPQAVEKIKSHSVWPDGYIIFHYLASINTSN